jgi:hypothetical protein
MKFWIEVEWVGSIEKLDSLAKESGYDRDEVALLTDSQDVEAIHEHFGPQGRRYGINDFGGFFVVARDGDYNAIWGFEGNVPYLDKSMYEIKWKLVEERERIIIQSRFVKYPDQKCPHCGDSAIEHAIVRNPVLKRWFVICRDGTRDDEWKAQRKAEVAA